MALNLMHHQQAAPATAQPESQYYSGQWTSEEQEYVSVLVDGFKNGTLDIADGTSLRFFIAAKLGCKPKRVSKKYERSGYNGKQVYRRDTNVSAPALAEYRKKLKACEAAFKESRALVVSMQEAKSDSKSAVTETPVISLHQNTSANSDLAAMRSRIDQQLAFRYGQYATGQTMSSPEMLQAMMIQRQRAAALGGAQIGGFSSRFTATSATQPAVGTGAPTNKLLIDLYQRRQQLMMTYMAGAHAPTGTVAGMGMPAMSTIGNGPLPTTLVGDNFKRDFQHLEAAGAPEEPAPKRPRAA